MHDVKTLGEYKATAVGIRDFSTVDLGVAQ